jgi:hypothetical protein
MTYANGEFDGNLLNRTITSPLDGRLSRGKAIFMALLCWAYATPWTVMPLMEIWGRFVPGKTIKDINKINL